MRTLLISLGGARYPSAPDLIHEAFAPSSKAIAQCFSAGVGAIVVNGDYLNLFDDDRSWADQLIATRNWIRQRKAEGDRPENIIVHYVGHGWFKPNSEDHLLTINHTDKDEKLATSAALGTLNSMLLREAGKLRRYYIIDACFAAASMKDLMTNDGELFERHVGQIIGAWPEETGEHGVAALFSAGKTSSANAKGRSSLTQFTDGLMTVLEAGDRTDGSHRSLRRVFEALKLALPSVYGDLTIKPVLVAPNDAGGGIAGVPIFVNQKPMGALASIVSSVGTIVGGIASSCIDLEERSKSVIEPSRQAIIGTGEPGFVLPVLPPLGREDSSENGSGAVLNRDAALSENLDFRTMMYRFFRLPPSQMAEIVGVLKLDQSGDVSMTELDRLKAALRQARADGKIGSLEKLITKAEAKR